MGENENTATNIIEPPASAAVPVDVAPSTEVTTAPADDKGANDAGKKEPVKEPSKVKLPSSIKPPVKNGRFQARISDLVAQRNAIERENAELREKLSKTSSSITRPTKDGAKPGGAATGSTVENNTGEAINPEDFATYGEYIEALVTKTMEQKESAAQSEKASKEFAEHREKRMTAFNEQAEPLAAEYGDGFWDAITDPSLPVSEAMADAILELDEMGPYMMLYLAAHKDQAAKVAQMNPRAATIAIGRLAVKLENEINSSGEGSGSEGNETVGNNTPTPAATTPAATTPAAPRPSPVPVPRGSTAPLDAAAPSDKDDVDTWLRKETDRLRRINPNARFYGAR